MTLGDHGVGGIAGRATVGEATAGDTRWAACTKADRVRLNIVRRMVFNSVVGQGVGTERVLVAIRTANDGRAF